MLSKQVKRFIYLILPLQIRKLLAIFVNRQNWIPANNRGWWATQLIQDFATKDINAYHKFLWQHHLSYAESYESNLRFGYENLNETRKIFFSDLQIHLNDIGFNPKQDINSVFEVGCSLGYLLHYMESDVFPAATILEGNDIDEYSIQEGKKYLSKQNSKVNIMHADMEQLEKIINGKKYDVIFGTGILLYLTENSASSLVESMLSHTNKILTFTGLAHPKIDNSSLEKSVSRTRDGTWIHNIDKMITNAGGKIIARRWEGDKVVNGNTIYFVFATPKST